MTRNEKEKWLRVLLDEFSASRMLIFAEFSGLDVQDMERIRKEIKKLSCQIKVLKNTLVKKTFQAMERESACKFLAGPHVVIWSRTGDEAEVLKSLTGFAKRSGKLTLKFGILDNEVVETAYLESLSKLPAKKVLQAWIVGSLNAPFARIINGAKYPMTHLVHCLKAIEKERS
jgi:large subunit ribosomal protein L10